MAEELDLDKLKAEYARLLERRARLYPSGNNVDAGLAEQIQTLSNQIASLTAAEDAGDPRVLDRGEQERIDRARRAESGEQPTGDTPPMEEEVKSEDLPSEGSGMPPMKTEAADEGTGEGGDAPPADTPPSTPLSQVNPYETTPVGSGPGGGFFRTPRAVMAQVRMRQAAMQSRADDAGRATGDMVRAINETNDPEFRAAALGQRTPAQETRTEQITDPNGDVVASRVRLPNGGYGFGGLRSDIYDDLSPNTQRFMDAAGGDPVSGIAPSRAEMKAAAGTPTGQLDAQDAADELDEKRKQAQRAMSNAFARMDRRSRFNRSTPR